MNLDDLNADIRRWIDIREGIQREITASKAQTGANTGRQNDRLHHLENEYQNVQQRILEIDRQIRELERRPWQNGR